MIRWRPPQAGEGKLAFTLRRPVGVVGAISPFNFPLQPRRAQARARARRRLPRRAQAGDPDAALRAPARRARAGGGPSGRLAELVAGPAAAIGDVLVGDERVRLITFTGSSGVGWGLQERAPRKNVRLELGNSTPAIVARRRRPRDGGREARRERVRLRRPSCISVQRIYVERSVHDDFVARLVPKVEALTVGDPADEATDVGPVIDAGNRDRILAWIEEARAAGGELLAGGRDGDLIRPTLLGNVPDDAKVSCEEVFGPVAVVNAVDSVDEAIERANATDFGLQAGIFTASIATALRAAEGLEFGGVTVNEAPTFRSDQMPYGGVKGSGNTKEGPAFTVREMTEERLVVLQR